MKSDSRWVAVGAFFAMIAVVFGAFAAHGLRSVLSASDLQVFQTAVHYQMIHAFGLISLGVWSERHPSPRVCWIGLAFTVGILVFSGSLYALSMYHYPQLGMITPIGGLLYIVGWFLFGIEALKAR